MNQYTSYNGTEQFSYDPNGNLVSKVTPGGTERYEFDAEGQLIHTESASSRCSYFYDAFGNLNMKNCSTGSYQYLVDPFGIYGGDIIAEISEDETTYFVHSRGEGLLAALNSNGNSDLFYEFNMDG
jgi:YD repeat-containing protein